MKINLNGKIEMIELRLGFYYFLTHYTIVETDQKYLIM